MYEKVKYILTVNDDSEQEQIISWLDSRCSRATIEYQIGQINTNDDGSKSIILFLEHYYDCDCRFNRLCGQFEKYLDRCNIGYDWDYVY